MSQSGRYISGGPSPGSAIETITGNIGGAVSPTAGNVNIVGSGTVVVVGNPGTSTLTISLSGTTVYNYTNVTTTPYVVVPTDDFLGVTTSVLAITINLPNAPQIGRVYTIKDISGNAQNNNITVTTVGGAVLIDGATSFVMDTAYQSINVLFNGTAYLIF